MTDKPLHPLVKKLYLTKKPQRLLYNQSPYSPELLELDGLSLEIDPKQTYDAIFAHVYNLEEMAALAKQVEEDKLLAEDGRLFFVYPKLANKVGLAGIHRDSIFPALAVDEETGYIKGSQLKFNRMISLNEVFTIIGMVYLSPSKKTRTSKSGQVATYAHHIPDLQASLPADLQPVFDKLTPGRKRDWARRIYSAKRQETKDKRRQELLDYLRAVQ